MHQFKTGSKRSEVKPRYDLIPKVFLDRLAQRFTGDLFEEGPTGGALEYGEVNWMRGLPTSDVINHIIDHLTTYSEELRLALLEFGNNFPKIRERLIQLSNRDDHLFGAAWGIAVLAHQEYYGPMFHDDRFQTGSPADEKLVQNEQPEEKVFVLKEKEKMENDDYWFKSGIEYANRAARADKFVRNKTAKKNRRTTRKSTKV